MGGSFWTSTWAIIIYVVVGLALIIGIISLVATDPGVKTRGRVEAYAQHEEAKVAGWAKEAEKERQRQRRRGKGSAMGNVVSVGPRAPSTMVFPDVKDTARNVTKSALRRSLSCLKGSSRLLPRVRKILLCLEKGCF